MSAGSNFPAANGTRTMGRSSLGAILLVVLVDLIGFSIIFPLFPAMLEHYLGAEGPDSPIGRLVALLESLAPGQDKAFVTAVLFGGVLGSVYSFLQFIAAPFWGRLSDRVGRRRVLLFTVGGTALSYLLWVFSGSFLLLLLARALGGLMAGNIAVATAAVADVTEGRERARAMALVGVAFGLGFVIGPAIGGLASLVDFTRVYPGATALGINPFSFPALCALFLATANFLWVFTHFRETLPESGESNGKERADPRLLGSVANPAARLACRVYFVLMLAFAGMEFTLTFLAVERLFYQPTDMIWMFLFIGLMLALSQGFIVRRFVRRTGEIAMALSGMLAAFLGLVALASSHETIPFYTGLGLLAVGIGLTSPTLGALVSLYSGKAEQGRHLGAFRAYGALARAIGPFIAAVLFWQFGSTLAYLAAAGVMLLAVLGAILLPKPFVPAEDNPSQTREEFGTSS